MKKRENDEEITLEPETTGETEIVEEEMSAEKKVAKIRAELAACDKERKEYLDGWQRAKADYVNALRRFDEDQRATERLGKMAAVKALLPALDALKRAESQGELPEGFTAILKQLQGAFAALGIAPLGVLGEAFDPSYHEALGTDETSDEKGDSTISAVLEVGWKMGDFVIRPAKVRVARLKT